MELLVENYFTVVLKEYLKIHPLNELLNKIMKPSQNDKLLGFMNDLQQMIQVQL